MDETGAELVKRWQGGRAHEFMKQAGFLTNQILINWGTREVEIKDDA